MADTVRNLMEVMVPELEDYERRGYFSRNEIGSIVSRRQQFEYNLRRRNAVKSDFLRYYQYEWKLEQLRRSRRKERNISGKRSLADYGIVRRIHFIFDRATRKFKGDLGVWMAWLHFCKQSTSTQQVSKVVARALKLHPNAPFLWAYAAAWEFEGNNNPVAARLLMQSGVKNCKEDRGLWLEYFRMELLYAQKLLARRKALGVGGGAHDNEEEASADALILAGRLAQLVHDQAVQRVPDDAAFRARFLRLCHDIPCKGSAKLISAITSQMMTAFDKSPQGCKMLAESIRDCLMDPELGSGVAAACTFLYEKVQASRDSEVQASAVAFVAAELDKCSSEPGDDCSQEQTEALTRVLELCVKAPINGNTSPEVTVFLCRAYIRQGRVQAADEVLSGALTESPAACSLWELAFECCACHACHACTAGPDGAEATAAAKRQDACALVARALSSVAQDRQHQLLLPALTLLLALQADIEVLLQALYTLLQTRRSDDLDRATASVYMSIRSALGSNASERFAKEVARYPSPGPQYWCTRLSTVTATCCHQRGSTRTSTTQGDAATLEFELAVASHGQDCAQIWLMWAEYCRSRGGNAGAIHDRAMRTLRGDVADFYSVRVLQTSGFL